MRFGWAIDNHFLFKKYTFFCQIYESSPNVGRVCTVEHNSSCVKLLLLFWFYWPE